MNSFHADLVPNNIFIINVTQRKVISPDVCLQTVLQQNDETDLTECYLLKPLKTWVQISISRFEYSKSIIVYYSIV